MSKEEYPQRNRGKIKNPDNKYYGSTRKWEQYVKRLKKPSKPLDSVGNPMETKKK